ncbi:MAG TPA: response regulator [Polyangiaceae bacterium]|jgi:CheY-like chemotaxis protein
MEPDAKTENPPTVLIVDDFDDSRTMYAAFLRYSGYGVVEAANGIEAIEQATATLPDVIVMDLSLPELDGWEATRRIKSEPRTGRIPIVALTGHTLEGPTEDARRAGCDAFLAKPCLPDTLLETIRGLLGKRAERS